MIQYGCGRILTDSDTDPYRKGNTYERKIAKELQELGYTGVVTSRSESKKMDDNIFDMIDAMFKKNSNKAFRIYNDLKSLGNEPVSLVSIIATQVRFLYQILVLSNKGYNESNIANELSAHPFRVRMGMEKVRHYSEYELEELLDELSKLDIQIKTGDIDRFVGLELFILKMSN